MLETVYVGDKFVILLADFFDYNVVTNIAVVEIQMPVFRLQTYANIQLVVVGWAA